MWYTCNRRYERKGSMNVAKHMAGPQGGHYRLKQPQKREKHNRIPARILKSRARLLLSGAGCIAAVLIITALLAMPHQNAEPIEAAASPEAVPSTAAENTSDKASVLSETASTPESAFQQLGDWRLVLVNSEVPLPDDFQMTPTLFDTITVNSKMYPELTALINAAYNDEINLWVASGYRSVEEQESVLDRAVQRRMADGMTYENAYEDARITIQAPGYSEHHTGLAVDFNDVEDDFRETEAYTWLRSTPQNTALSSATPKARRASPASITSRGITATSARSTRSA